MKPPDGLRIERVPSSDPNQARFQVSATLDWLLGCRVVPTAALPAYPSPGEDARRLVRHGFADVLAWHGDTLYVSAWLLERLRVEARETLRRQQERSLDGMRALIKEQPPVVVRDRRWPQ